jgi:hypothetical protein
VSGLRTFGQSVKLNELEGELLALKYAGEAENVTTKFGTDNVARAQVVQFTEKDGKIEARGLGETLVFQRAIANDIRGSSEWAVGVFEKVERPTAKVPDATMYQLSDPTIDLNILAGAMAQANIAL